MLRSASCSNFSQKHFFHVCSNFISLVPAISQGLLKGFTFMVELKGKTFASSPLSKLQFGEINLFSPLGLFCLAIAIRNSFSCVCVCFYFNLLKKCVTTVVEFQWFGLFWVTSMFSFQFLKFWLLSG